MDVHYPNLNFSISAGDLCMQVLSARYFTLENPIPEHYHGSDRYEIHLIPSGRGSARIDGTLYQIEPGMLYVTGPYVTHSQTSLPDNPMTEYSLYFRLNRQGNADPELSFQSPKAQAVFSTFMEHPSWIGIDTQNLQGQMQTLIDELMQCQFGYELRVKALLMQILVSIVRDYQGTNASKKPAKKAVPTLSISAAQQASVIIESYFLSEYQTLSLEDLCTRLHLSPRQTERLLKSLYGKTFSQKKLESRMSAASMLLSETQLSITEISEKLGYSSVEYFSNAFRNYYKISPSSYRSR